MSRSGLVLVLAAVFMLGGAGATHGQAFTVGHSDIGPTIGLGSIGSASLAIGGRFERGMRTVPELGDGVIGLQFGADYYSWSGGSYRWSYIPIGVTGNYHIALADNDKIDPFVGLGLGYTIISCNYDGFGGGDLCGNSALYFIAKAGVRYFLSEKLALYADAGAGAALLNVGAMFRLR
jgi:hypothetical protein